MTFSPTFIESIQESSRKSPYVQICLCQSRDRAEREEGHTQERKTKSKSFIGSSIIAYTIERVFFNQKDRVPTLGTK